MKIVLPVILSVLVISGCSSTVQKGAIISAYSSFEARNYESTIHHISVAENAQNVNPELKAELTYLKAQTYEKLGEYGKANSLYSYLAEQHKNSQYGYLAKQRLEQKL